MVIGGVAISMVLPASATPGCLHTAIVLLVFAALASAAATGDAARLIRDGQTVTVDGASGTVTLA